MSDDLIVQHANKLAFRDMEERKPLKELPRPRTTGEVAATRLKERSMEAVAPSTGYSHLDSLIKGFIPGHLYTVTGNENVGKTSLACNFSVRVARQKRKVLYFALEPENTVVDYIASVRFDKRFDELTEADIRYDDGYIHIYGKDEVRDLDTLVKIVEGSEHYDLIVVDHIGYFINDTHNTNQEQANALKKLAGLAKRKQCAILLIAHLRKRSANQKRDYTPTSDDISGSGAFKQDSTEVMIVVRLLDDVADPDNVTYSNLGTLYVTKTKCGPNGKMSLLFEERKACIKENVAQEGLSDEATYAVLTHPEAFEPVSKQELEKLKQTAEQDMDRDFWMDDDY